jgi:hypothetical protein
VDIALESGPSTEFNLISLGVMRLTGWPKYKLVVDVDITTLSAVHSQPTVIPLRGSVQSHSSPVGMQNVPARYISDKLVWG